MAVVVQPTFGGYDYAANDCDINKWRDEGQIRGAVTPIPRSDVARAQDGFLGPRQVSVEGSMGGETWSSRDDLRAALDAFAYAHRPGFRQLFRDTDRYLTAEVRSLTVGDDEGFLHLPYSIRFEAADPYWYAAVADADAWAAPANGATKALNNGGAATSLPKFTLTANAGGTLALTLWNDTSGASLGLAGVVAGGDVLVVDCAAQTVTLNGANKLSYFSGDFWALQPGNNTVRLVLAGATLTSLNTAWTKRWL